MDINDSELLRVELTKVVSDYYPISLEFSNEPRAGNVALKKKIEQKINELINVGELIFCNALELEIKRLFSDHLVFVENYKQFPNYAISIELLKREFAEIDIVYNLKLRVSLLTNHFTAFYEEISFHKNSSNMLSKFMPVKLHLISSIAKIADRDGDYLSLLVNAVEKCLLGYKFVSHYLLFNTTIEIGTPHGLDEFTPKSGGYPIYAFLFDNEYNSMDNVYITY